MKLNFSEDKAEEKKVFFEYSNAYYELLKQTSRNNETSSTEKREEDPKIV